MNVSSPRTSSIIPRADEWITSVCIFPPPFLFIISENFSVCKYNVNTDKIKKLSTMRSRPTGQAVLSLTGIWLHYFGEYLFIPTFSMSFAYKTLYQSRRSHSAFPNGIHSPTNRVSPSCHRSSPLSCPKAQRQG